jgi:hypothetical protein
MTPQAELRQKTLTRAFLRYWDWFNRAIGWATIIWFACWFIFFLVSSLQILKPLPNPIEVFYVQIFLNSVILLTFCWNMVMVDLPPVMLNRRDLHRLLLAPIDTRWTLSWAFQSAMLVKFLFGILLGGFWWVAAFLFLGIHTPLALVAIPLYFLALLEWQWVAYSKNREVTKVFIFLGLSIFLEFIGLPILTGSLLATQFLGLVAPIMLFIYGIYTRLWTLKNGVPRQFPTQSLILSQIQAVSINPSLGIQTINSDTITRLRRLLQNKKSNCLRSITAPKQFRAFEGLAWRSALILFRRPIAQQFGLLITILFAFFSNSDIIESGFFGILKMYSLRYLTTQLILIDVPETQLPIGVQARTFGRIFPSVMILICAFLPIQIIIGVVQPSLELPILISLSRVVLTLIIHEKLTVWLRLSAHRIETGLGAACITVFIGFVFHALVLDFLLLPVQLLLIGIVLLTKRF